MVFDPDSDSLPRRSEIPHEPGTPEGAVWLWGQDDELGRLNLLTPRRRAAAAKLIRKGEVVNLNWSAHLPNPPMFGREPFSHTIKPLGGGQGNDDLLSYNSQGGSQWDGFRHVALKHNGKWTFYNNITTEHVHNTTKCGVQAWAAQGIVGRGVLLDYWEFMGKSYDPNTRHAISLNNLKACAQSQGVTFQYGDILLVRTGWIDVYTNMTQPERVKLTQVPLFAHDFVGVDQTEEMADFLHDNYFSAVASDAPAFEVWPQAKDVGWNHHVNLLPLWGVPIGELWDLERLAEVCKESKQYAFFLASTPMNVDGAVGSPANAISMF